MNDRNEQGSTPMHEVAFGGDEATAQILLNKNAFVNVENEKDNTPLCNAVSVGPPGSAKHQSIIQWLLKHGDYSYQRQPIDKFLLGHLRNSAFATQIALLLAGVNTQGIILSETLRPIQINIESAVAVWLNSLHLSSETCHEVTPPFLKALPQLIDWLDMIKQSLEIKYDNEDRDYATLSFKKAKNN